MNEKRCEWEKKLLELENKYLKVEVQELKTKSNALMNDLYNLEDYYDNQIERKKEEHWASLRSKQKILEKLW